MNDGDSPDSAISSASSRRSNSISSIEYVCDDTVSLWIAEDHDSNASSLTVDSFLQDDDDDATILQQTVINGGDCALHHHRHYHDNKNRNQQGNKDHKNKNARDHNGDSVHNKTSREGAIHEVVLSAARDQYNEKSNYTSLAPTIATTFGSTDITADVNARGESVNHEVVLAATSGRYNEKSKRRRAPTTTAASTAAGYDNVDHGIDLRCSLTENVRDGANESQNKKGLMSSMCGMTTDDAISIITTVDTDRVLVVEDVASTTSSLSNDDDGDRQLVPENDLENLPQSRMAVARQVSESDIEQERTRFIREVQNQIAASISHAEVVRDNTYHSNSDNRTILSKRQRLEVYCISFVCLLFAMIAIISTVSVEKANRAKQPSNRSSPPMSTMGIQRASDAPAQTPVVYLPDGRRAFTSTTQLYAAIDAYHDSLVANQSKVDIATMTYGFPISTWDVSRITDFSRVFDLDRDRTLDSNFQPMTRNVFNEDLSGWDMSNAVTVRGMFVGASNFVGDGLAEWNVSKVRDFSYTFAHATSFNGNISKWDTSSAVHMEGMFLNSIAFNGDLSAIKVSQVQSMAYMFQSATSYKGYGDLSRWDVSRVHDMSAMFFYAMNFEGNVSNWNTTNVVQMDLMFASATSFNSDISSWSVGNVQSMSHMFNAAVAMSDVNLSQWDTSRVTDMSLMFKLTPTFNGDVSQWDTSRVTNFEKMFFESGTFNGDISRWNTSSATTMKLMFRAAHSFSSDITRWDTRNVESMSGMFKGAANFNRDLSLWNVSSLVDASDMLSEAITFNHSLCSWIDQLVQVSKTTSFTGMFTNSACVNTSDPTSPQQGPFCFNCMLLQ